jgi:hypothetical protein
MYSCWLATSAPAAPPYHATTSIINRAARQASTPVEAPLFGGGTGVKATKGGAALTSTGGSPCGAGSTGASTAGGDDEGL